MQYDKKMMKKMADNFESYLDIVDRYVIIDGLSEEEYETAKKRVKKLIKKLRKGEGDEVFDEERYREFMRECSNDGF